MLCKDGPNYWKGQTIYTAQPWETEQAFDDLVKCGPMTRHVCGMAGLDPEWISAGFIRWCESMA